MKSLVLTLTILLSFSLSTYAAIDPKYKEAVQRGYELSGDSVVFPDGSRCLLEDFNDTICGQEWMTTDYCIPEGTQVWDEERCCDGLVAYLPEETDGQAKCITIAEAEKNERVIGWITWGALLAVIMATVFYFQQKKRYGKR